MADKTIGELPALSTMEDDTLIPVEHDGSAKSMSGTVLGNYVYGLVEDDVEVIARIIAVGPKGDDGVSPTLSATKTGKVTTVYFTDATHSTPTVLTTLNDGADAPTAPLILNFQDPNAYATLAAELPITRPVFITSTAANASFIPVSVSSQRGHFRLAAVVASPLYTGLNVYMVFEDGSWSSTMQSLIPDTAPTQNSDSLITSGAVYAAILGAIGGGY